MVLQKKKKLRHRGINNNSRVILVSQPTTEKRTFVLLVGYISCLPWLLYLYYIINDAVEEWMKALAAEQLEKRAPRAWCVICDHIIYPASARAMSFELR